MLRHTVLLVDDAPDNLDLLRAILEPVYRLKVAATAARALQIVLSDEPPDLILLDIMMPEMNGYELCQKIKRTPSRNTIPLIFVTGLHGKVDEEFGLSLGAADYFTKPFTPSIVLARVRTHLALYDQACELERLVDLRTTELQQTRLQVIMRLGRAAEFRDNETGYHVLRMAHYSRLICSVGRNASMANLLFQAAPMHDIGKIGIPDAVLLKPGKLDAEEWRIMQTHAAIGADIIGRHDDELLSLAHTVALSHHEKWDGSGYPAGLRGDQIPLAGRIVAIADVFDALTSARPYKPAWPVVAAVEYIVGNAGKHFDPSLIAAFQQVLPTMLETRLRYAESSIHDDPKELDMQLTGN